MKLGIITDEVTQDIKIAVDFATKHGLHGVELRSIEDLNVDEISINRIKEIDKIIKAEGLEVCNISSSFFKCSIDNRKEYVENMDKLKRLIERAKIFGCNTLRGFAFFQSGSYEERFEEIIENFLEPIELLEKENITLLIEADPSVFTTNCRKVKVLLDRINSKYVQGIYDPGNDIYDGDMENPYPEGFEYLKDYIKHVHIKDAMLIEGKPQSVKVGTGAVPFSHIFRSLKNIGYKDYVVLETHYRPQAEIPEELLKRPKGTLFSLNGDIASEESIIELKKLIKPYI